MGWQIVKNPETEMYQVYSSIVDGFLLDAEHDIEELRQFWLFQNSKADMAKFDQIIADLDAGNPPYGDLTMTYEDAKMWDTHQASHGPKSRHPDTCKICKEILDDEKRSS
jgi:hypothetical protein